MRLGRVRVGQPAASIRALPGRALPGRAGPTPAAVDRARTRDNLLTVAALAWLVLAAEAVGTAGHHQGAAGSTNLLALAAAAAGWLLMLTAMMFPLLGTPIGHVRARSLARRRARAVALFTAGYLAAWSAAAIPLTSLTVLVTALDTASEPVGGSAPSLLSMVVTVVLAAVWQVSPAKQRCLNRCHAHPSLAAFGPAADRDALRFGLIHGGWCVGNCWAVMLATLAAPATASLPASAAATALLATERLVAPTPPAWRLRIPQLRTRSTTRAPFPAS